MHQALYQQVMRRRAAGAEKLDACHQAVQTLYPELKLRWANIYGRRWSHVLGAPDTGDACSQSRQIRLNEELGVIISRYEQIPEAELALIIDTLQQYLA